MADIVGEVWRIAEECGFSHIGELAVDTIKLRIEARQGCEVNKCGHYGKSWSCPPGCGTLEDCDARLRKYKRGLLLQSTGQMEDSFDYETIEGTSRKHGECFDVFRNRLHENYPDVFLIGGVCRQCKTCTYPDAPCRFPDKTSYSMEGLGMIVSEVCKDNNIPYYYGPNTITFIGAVLLD
jgi:predicted metal-binding protein